MILCGLSTPQVVTLTGTLFPVPAIVLVTPPDCDAPIRVTPIESSATAVTFAFTFNTCGTYGVVIADATGACDHCASEPFQLDTTPRPCPGLCTPQTLGMLRADTLHRLGDEHSAVWSTDEVDGYLIQGYQEIATELPVFWDQTYLENLPRGFSYTQPWEKFFVDRFGGFNYGVGNFTAEFERRAGQSIGFDERKRYGPANHTSPFEATDGLLSRIHASTAIPATAEMPRGVTKLDRVLWDNRAIDALEPRTFSRMDSRYEITAGEVHGFMWQKDGVRTLRKVRVPNRQADTYTINGGWGLLRTPADLSPDTVTGTWGIVRLIEGQQPLGELFGAARRPYREGSNVRVEHFRHGRALDTDTTECELPTRYALYLRDYAQWCCLSRPGPGYDEALAQHFEQRWKRGLARIARRLVLVDMEHTYVMGGDGAPSTSRPPRPSLPWAYGSRVR